jgi:hypothetical protein
LDITVYGTEPNAEGFTNQDARDFTVPLRNNTKDENIILLLDLIEQINSNTTKNNNNLSDMINTTKFYNIEDNNFRRLYNFTSTLFTYQNFILWESKHLDEYKEQVDIIINRLIEEKVYDKLSVEQKFLLGGLRSLYNKLNAQASA